METKSDLIEHLQDVRINLEELAYYAVLTGVVLAICLVAWKILSSLLKSLQKSSGLPQQVLGPLRVVIRYGLIFVAIMLLLSAYGIPIGNFWTVISTILGLVAIGFVAVWSILSNISSTLLILLAKPFKIGDYIKVEGDFINGRINAVNVMFTTVVDNEGNVFRIPNNQFFQKTILISGNKKPFNTNKPQHDESSDAPDHRNANLEGIVNPSKAGR